MIFYECFSGGGMARIGLGNNWECVFANDIDSKKVAAYRGFYGHEAHLIVGDIANLTPSQLPGHADLAWASFPCQDLSLAGNGAGLGGNRSGTFWPFWRLMQQLRAQSRAPRLIVLEYVYGAITSHGGRDLAAIVDALVSGGYTFGPLVVDAVHFLPQSRPRLFIVALDKAYPLPPRLLSPGPMLPWHPDAFELAYDRASRETQDNWVWWGLPIPGVVQKKLSDIIEDEPTGVEWHTKLETRRLLQMMSPLHARKIADAKLLHRRTVGTLYRRTRLDSDGIKRQRAEVRFDGVSGCLRTPVGGSSRQTVIVVNGNTVRSRLLSPREAARLMGVPENYPLPANYNEAYHVFGDGVAIPVVRHLERNLLRPLLGRSQLANAA